ncbi:MAG: hypothetical protein IJV46_02005 [Acidaminococcaceae bacterium]|nr:hypothetical protein [Acidaminococcaceae bacterium]
MRFWTFGVFLLCCSLFGLPGCSKAEEKPAPKPETPYTPSEIQKSEISFYLNECSYELIMKRDEGKILCTMRTLKQKAADTGAPPMGFTGMNFGNTGKKTEWIFPRGCRFTADERALAELDALLQKGGVRQETAVDGPVDTERFRLLYVEYKNGKHAVVRRPGKDNGFPPKEAEAGFVAFMERLAQEHKQKLYDGDVLSGPLLKCSFSSAGSSSGGHHFADLTRTGAGTALFESRRKDWFDAPEKEVKKEVPASILEEMEALGREYRIDTWALFPKSDLIALDAASETLSVTYGEPWSWVQWTLSMESQDELDKKQSEYYRKLQHLLLQENK